MAIRATFGDPPAALAPPWRTGDTIASSAADVAYVAGGQIVFGNAGSAVLTNATRSPSKRTVIVDPASDSIALGPSRTVPFSAGATVPLPTTTTAGLPITYASSDASVAEPTSGGAGVVVRGAGGPITITATGSGDANHDPPAAATVQLTVTQVAQTVAFGPLAAMPVGKTYTLPATSSAGLPVTYASSSPGVASVSGNTLVAVAPGSAVISGNQPGNADVAQATPLHRTVIVYAWSGQTDSASSLTDVDVELDAGVRLTGQGQVGALDAAAAGDISRKHFRLDVPDYSGQGNASQPRTYLHLGAYPTMGTALDRGDDMLAAVGLEIDPVTWSVADNWFFDDHRDALENQRSTTRYRVDDGVTAPPEHAANFGLAQSELTAKLVSRGGWREHTDGNRISTTRGDRVDVIGGNYRLLVLGRMWDQRRMHAGETDPDPTGGWGISYWESSGGHNRDSTNQPPDEIARIAYKEGTWQTIVETLKGDCESNYYGVQEEYFRGPSLTSRVGSSTPTEAIPDAGADGSDQQSGDKPDWVNWAGRLQQKPSISEITEASTVTSHTIVNTSIDDDTTVENTIRSDTLAGGGGVSLYSYTPASLSDDDVSAAGGSGSLPTHSIRKFHERLHCAATLSHEEFATKTEKESGGWSFEVDIPAFLSAEFSLAATASLTVGELELAINVNIAALELFLGLSAEMKVGIFGEVNVFDSHGTTLGRSLKVTAPLKVSVENLKTETEAVKFDIQAYRLRTAANAVQT